MNKIGIKYEFDELSENFYNQNYDLVDTPDFNKKTRLLKPQHGLYYLGNKSYRVCRFCKKTEPEVTFNDVAHVFPESIGNKALASFYECDSCNHFFGDGIDNDYSKFFLMHHNLMNVFGKNGSPKFGWKVSCPLRTEECMKYCINIEWKDGRYNIGMCREVDNRYFQIGKDTAILSLPIPKCNPIAVFKALVKMAITALPFTELNLFDETIKWLLDNNHKNIYISGKKLIIRYEMIPGFNVIEYPHFIIYRRKHTIFNVPYMLFNLTYGCFSLLIEVPRDNDHTIETINQIPFPPIPFYMSDSGYWDMSNDILQPNQVHKAIINFGNMTEITDEIKISNDKGRLKIEIENPNYIEASTEDIQF